jgi:hypothetical protein
MRVWLKAALWAALLMPFGIVLHEGAHYLAYLVYDLPNASLSYAFGGFEGMEDFWAALKSGDRAGAAQMAPIFDVGMSALFGVMFTLLLGGLGICLMAWRNSLVGGVLAITSLFRSLAIVPLYVMGTPDNTDEAHIAITLGIPDTPLLIVGVAGFLVAAWLLARRFGWLVLMSTALALIASLAAWMTVLGPLLLP